ncbi:MAG: nucleotidyl transferase AbiEii/AbiGii toxin family protein [Atopobiaceae bacterium]
MDENGYSRLLKLRYATYVGEQEKDPMLIDLSLDCEITQPPERMEPKNRVMLEDVVTADYLLYPLPDQLADKLCAVMERQPGDWPSSRMKDLVDIVLYVTGERFDLAQLVLAIDSECVRRGMEVPRRFEAPEEWRRRFPAFAKRSGLSKSSCDFDYACGLAAKFFTPALEHRDECMRWNPSVLEWHEG